MINKELREKIANINEQCILFDNPSYDNSIIGMTFDGHALYDFELMIEEYMTDENCSEEEAFDFIDYNIIGFGTSYSGTYYPIVVKRET